MHYKNQISQALPSTPSGLPEGFEMVSTLGDSHFLYVDEKYWGDRTQQRTVGASICSTNIVTENYCEVYFFASKQDIPITFPIMNRLNPIGIFEAKQGHRKLHTLTGNRPEDKGTVTFVRNRDRITSGSR